MNPDHSFEALTPSAFLLRSGKVYADRCAIVDGDKHFTYAQFLDRSLRLAGALERVGVKGGDHVAILAPNSHVMLEAHFGVPFAGAVLVTLNYRLTASDLTYIVDHSGASILIYDIEQEAVAHDIAAHANATVTLIRAGADTGTDEYEQLLDSAPPVVRTINEERGLLAINYTSGTTGQPKGVMYSHRGAYLQSLAMSLHNGLTKDSVYLWTLPMFHCNGWSFPWAITAAGGTHVCLRKADPAQIWHHIHHSGVTHLSAAPTLVTMMAWHAAATPVTDPASPQRPTLRIGTGGSPPTPALLQRMAELGIEMTHLYGLTESYGPSVICDWHTEWNALPIADQAKRKARQGVGNVISQPVRVVAEDGSDVPADGITQGEIALRGNNIMLGYYCDADATRKACPDGWFRSGDVGVMHADGYIELKDRSKDIIISGGENIASVEVEQAIASHPAVLETAVVAAPDEKWGEVPVAFVTLKPGATVEAPELIAYLRTILAGYKVPKQIVFGELLKTSTGKTQKYLLRERAKSLKE
jgi:fatty-acyl-CoA synthase